eukprot:359867-Chlamydomonas_euryale.AAC.5
MIIKLRWSSSLLQTLALLRAPTHSPPKHTHASSPLLQPHLVRLGAQPAVHVHGDGEELRERAEAGKQHDDEAAALDRLDRASQQVGRERLKVLQYAHPKGVAKDVLRLVVVRVADARRRDKEAER